MSKKKIFNFVFILVSTVLLLYIILGNNDISTIINAFKTINPLYITGAIACLFVFWLLEAYMIYRLMIKISSKEKGFSTFWLAVKVTLVGQYYSNITPGASGGQPVQLYFMKDASINLSDGTAILFEKFLLFQIGVTLYSLALIIVKFTSLISYPQSVFIFVFLGLTVNVVMVLGILFISIKPKVISYILDFFASLLHKIRIIKDIDKAREGINSFIEEYKTSVKKMLSNKWLTLKLFVLTFVQLTLFFSITFFIYKSLHLSGTSLFEIICLQSFVYMSVCFIPIPGTIGVSELGFVMLLSTVFSQNLVSTALLLWRGITYYFSLLFSGIVVILTSIFKKRKSA